MDITTVLGLIIGVVVVTLAILTGSDLYIFLNLPGFLIVIGGTWIAGSKASRAMTGSRL